MKQKVLQRRVESANRSMARKLETAVLQLNSRQPLSAAQKHIDAPHPPELFRNVSDLHSTDLAWNRLDHLKAKQLDHVFINLQLKNEESAYKTIKQKVLKAREDEENQKAKKLQKRRELLEGLENARQRNQEVYDKLKLTRQPSPKAPTRTTEEPLFLRLAVPKEPYVPETTYDLPEFRGFTLKTFNHIDKHKNPLLLQHYATTGLIPRAVQRDNMKLTYVPEPKQVEALHNTVEFDEMNMEDDFKESAIRELEEFERKLRNQRPPTFSKFQDFESKMLSSVEGFKQIKKIRQLPNYKHILGKQISLQQLQK